MRFELAGDFEPRGDQPQAIAELVTGVEAGSRHQTLLGVTGSSSAWVSSGSGAGAGGLGLGPG